MLLTDSPPQPSPPASELPDTHWQELPAAQQPAWPDPSQVVAVQDRLALLPALTAPADVRRLGAALTHVSAGRAFLLQGGDCAEPTGATGVAALRGKHRVLGEMGEIISAAAELPTVTVGRIAGQYAKPRSNNEETVGGQVLPVYRGSLVNAPEPDAAARVPDPRRMLTGYHTARAVLNELHLIAHESASGLIPLASADAPDSALDDSALPGRPWDGTLRSVLQDYGQTRRTANGWRRTGLWTSHEALLLDYEQPLVRRDPHTAEQYLLSTHLPWIGDRTRQLDGAHVAFMATLANPVAVKVGPSITESELLELCGRLDPHRRPGRLTLIARLGAGQVAERLPVLVKAVASAGHDVVWAVDPMHGNTFTAATGHKTRHMTDILAETTAFFEVLTGQGQWPGGVHLEVAGEPVTECLGQGGPAEADGLRRAYRTLCDPRLNDNQARLLAEEVARLVARG